MQQPPARSPKTPVPEGRARLRDALFSSGDAPGGSQGELWVNRFGFPVWVGYYGSDPNFFSTELLERALALAQEPLST
jgi:hypothetical protein